MSNDSGQHQVAIVGRNNTKAAVTGQNELLVKINSSTIGSGLATEAKQDALIAKDYSTETTLQAVLAAIQTAHDASADYEAQLVTDDAGVRLLEVRTYNIDTLTWNAPLYFVPGSETPIAPVGSVIYEGSTTRSALTIPTVAAVPVTNWNAATAFTSDIISFQDRNKIAPWAFQITDYAIITGLPTMTLEVSLNGTDFTNYKTASTLIDMTDTVNNAFNFDDISPFEYMRFVYVPNGATGSFSMIVNK